MGAALDEISPDYLRDQRIVVRVLSVHGVSVQVRSGEPITLQCDYSGALPKGVSPPLIFEAKGPSSAGYQRRVFDRAPATIVWTPREGGLHQITLREAAHNRWFGVLKVSVEGEALASG